MQTNATYTGPDEYPIEEIPATEWWSENFASMYSSPADRLAIFYSIGRWHSDPSLWRELVMVSLPDSRVLHWRGFARNGTPTGPGGALSHYDVVEPGSRLHLTFDGPVFVESLEDLIAHGARGEPTKRCSIDLQFDSAAPLFNMKGDSEEAGSIAGSIHIDHIGTAEGTVDYDGRAYRFSDGYAVRDHSRGVREVSQYGGHNWISGSFPSGRAFYLYAMKLQGADEFGMSNAAVAEDGDLYPAEVLHTEMITSLDDFRQPHKIVLKSELGEMEVEVVETLNAFVSSMVSPYDTFPGATRHRPAAQFFDESVRMRCDGEEAHGWVERGFAEGPLA